MQSTTFIVQLRTKKRTKQYINRRRSFFHFSLCLIFTLQQSHFIISSALQTCHYFFLSPHGSSIQSTPRVLRTHPCGIRQRRQLRHTRCAPPNQPLLCHPHPPLPLQRPLPIRPYEEGDRRPRYDTRNEDPLITGIPTFALLNFLPPSTVLPKVLSLAIQPVDSSVTADSEDSSNAATAAAADIAVPGPPMFDYIAQIRHLTPQPWAIGLDQFWKWTQPPPGVSDFILTQELQDLRHQANLLPTEDWRLSEIRTNSRFWSWCFQVLFQCESN